MINDKILQLSVCSTMGYFNTYYIVNVLLILLYPAHKYLNLNTQMLFKKDSFGFTYENSIIYTMLTILCLNYVRSYSFPQFVSEAVNEFLFS